MTRFFLLSLYTTAFMALVPATYAQPAAALEAEKPDAASVPALPAPETAPATAETANTTLPPVGQAAAPQAPPPFDRNAYPMTTWPTLIKVLWHMGQLDTGKADDIDNTLRVLECDIYKRYTSDDFEWNEIRKAMVNNIAKNKASWPQKVSFVQPIELEEYDIRRRAFPLTTTSRWENVYRLQIAGNQPEFENECTRDLMDGIDNMPGNASLRMSRAFKLTELPISDEMAKTYIEYVKKKADENNGYSERVVYAKFYVSLDRYLGAVKRDEDAVRSNLAEFTGQIDRIDVYADPELKLPLYYKKDSFTSSPHVPLKDNANKPALIDTSKTIEVPAEQPVEPKAE